MAGFAGALTGVGMAGVLARFGGSALTLGEQMLIGGVSSAAGQGTAMAFGEQKDFNWTSLAASFVGGVLGGAIGMVATRSLITADGAVKCGTSALTWFGRQGAAGFTGGVGGNLIEQAAAGGEINLGDALVAGGMGAVTGAAGAAPEEGSVRRAIRDRAEQFESACKVPRGAVRVERHLCSSTHETILSLASIERVLTLSVCRES